MTAVRTVAIAGGGVAGMAAAILLAQKGVDVDLFETKSDIDVIGSGITLQGNALRIFDELGIWPEVESASYGFDNLTLRAPDPAATVIAEVPDYHTGGPDLPASVGMYRPDLARILADRAVEVGVRLHLGTSVASIESGLADTDTAVEFTTSDQVARSADLLIGADGLRSAVRGLMGIDVKPQSTGMGAWRAFVPRPDTVTNTEVIYGGSCFIAGTCPTGEDTMYAYLVERAQDHVGLEPSAGAAIMSELAANYHGPWDDIRADLSTSNQVHYTWFTAHLVPDAWNRGRVVLIGEAAHSCPPTIAQGAAMAAEDASVLVEVLADSDELDQATWNAFHERRLPRAKTVVDASVQVGSWLLEGRRDAPIPELMGSVAMLVTQPA